MAKQNVISLTELAANQVKLLLDKRGRPSFGIRVGVRSGGCAGYSYYIEYADNKNPFDEVIEEKGVRVLVDPKALIYLLNTEMDYSEGQFKSGFVFINPNKTADCGCGKSFSV